MEASALHQLGRLHLNDDNPTEAERCCKEALGLCKKAGDSKQEVEIMCTQVQAIMSMTQDRSDKNYKSTMDRATRVAADAVATAGKADERYLRGEAMYWHAHMLLASDKLQDA